MKRRKFIQKTVLASSALATATVSPAFAQQQKDKEFYEWRVYEMNRNQAPFDTFISKALIPAMNRLGVKKVGAFSEMSKSEPAKLYLLIPYASFNEYLKVNEALKTDKAFIEASADYTSIPVGQPVYSRYHTSLMTAFDGLPKMIAPATGPRIFELRTYEGYSEDAVRRKTKMFNDEEFVIFNRVKINPVFFGEVISGPNLPALSYLVTFKNMEERDQNWKAFFSDPDWLRILKDPQYANTVSKIYKIFLEPLPYSQV